VLESRGGKTLVRLVQSGFACQANWENEWYGSLDYGWIFMLTNLRHYLEHQAGRPRLVAWPRRMVSRTREEAFARLVVPQGLFAEGAAELRPGQRYALTPATGGVFSGRVEFIQPPRGFCLTVEPLNDALFWLTIESAQGKHDVQLWLSAYGIPQADVDRFTSEWGAVLEKLFA
jgi:hypothetical protein